MSDLSPDDKAALATLLRDTIAADRFPRSGYTDEVPACPAVCSAGCSAALDAGVTRAPFPICLPENKGRASHGILGEMVGRGRR